MRTNYIISAIIMLAVSLLGATAPDTVHHDLTVVLSPDSHSLEVKDQITLPGAAQEILFLLHGNLTVSSHSRDITITREPVDSKDLAKDIPVSRLRVRFKKSPKPETGAQTFTISYSGEIHHPVVRQSEEYARGFSQTPGIISQEGVYLANASRWFPQLENADGKLMTFRLQTDLPAGWDSVSQGTRVLHQQSESRTVTAWDSLEPMDEIYLVAARFQEYHQKVGNVDIMAFLRAPDHPLAQKYLDTTGQYLKMYETIIGPYPYTKFALVENFWETGYGMPSFTLLGSKIIRFPFILHSSYPHELLHNWWGNSVFVDYQQGNWCEGLTVYLADHLIKEQRGQGSQYRRTTLQGYTDYVNDTNDFPLVKFQSRFDAASSAIGYGKSMMVYHMLRSVFGDKQFLDAIKLFYKTNRFKTATFHNVQQAFETVTGADLGHFFNQWTRQTGAPSLKLDNADVTAAAEKEAYSLNFTMRQIQEEHLYTLDIPVAVSLEGQTEAELATVKMNQSEQSFTLTFKRRPLRVDIDPNFDLFRRLHPNEIPPALSNVFGAEEVLIILPSGTTPELKKAYRALADAWSGQRSARFTVKLDNQVESLPADKAVWIFGNENKFRTIIAKGLAPYDAQLNAAAIAIGTETIAVSDSSIVAAVRHPKSPKRVVVFLSAHTPEALPGLGRKLPHYGKYSYLAFTGTEPTNTHKGQWPAVNSPLTVYLANGDPQKSPASLVLPKSKPLAQLPPAFSGKRMRAHIGQLASEDFEGRAIGGKGIDKASHYIANQFREAGLKPAGDNPKYFQQWYQDGPGNSKILMRNIIGAIPGTAPKLKDQPVIICAHYDHLGVRGPLISDRFMGRIHPGADDNASGVAVMLELAQNLGNTLKPARPVLFIAFTGEESGLLGSKHYIDNLEKTKSTKVFAVVNLDTVGRLGDQKLKVIGSSSAREWRFIFMGIGFTTGIQTELLSQEIESGDHVPFIRAGVPAVHLFSGAHSDYHKPTDTADKIDAPGLEKVATVANELLQYLSQRTDPMTFTGKGASSSGNTATTGTQPSSSRKVKTGVMPDFSFTGKGVKAAQVAPGSAAQKAGLKPGDIITKLGPHAIDSLRTYAQALKQFKPNDTTTITYTRDGVTDTVSIKLEPR